MDRISVGFKYHKTSIGVCACCTGPLDYNGKQFLGIQIFCAGKAGHVCVDCAIKAQTALNQAIVDLKCAKYNN